MEKRGLISLRGVLLRYLVQTVFCCVLALLLWFAALMCVINSGLALPANQGRAGLPEGCTGRFAGHDCRHL